MEEGNKYQKAIKNYDCRERTKDLNWYQAKGAESLFKEIMAENHLVFRGIWTSWSSWYMKLRGSQTGSLKKDYTKTYYNKFSKVKDRTLKGRRQKHPITYTGIPIRLWRDFSQKPCRSRGSDTSHNPDDIVNVLKVKKKKKKWPRKLYRTKQSHSIKGEINIFPDKQKLSEFTTTGTALKKY